MKVVSLGEGGLMSMRNAVVLGGSWRHAPPDNFSKFACSMVESGGILAHDEPRNYIRNVQSPADALDK